MSRAPSWIEIVRVTANEIAPIAEGLDLGERAASALAERIRADLILIDETEGRAEAVRRLSSYGNARHPARRLLDRLFGKWLK